MSTQHSEDTFVLCLFDGVLCLIDGADEDTFVNNVRQVFARLRQHKIILNSKKTELGLEKVENVGHLVM